MNRESDNVQLDLLERLAKRGNVPALRQLGQYLIKGMGGEENTRSGRTKLLCAARSADRAASWLVALYFRVGKYDFEQDFEKGRRFAIRTEQRLKSDALLTYDDPELTHQARVRYEIWRRQRHLFFYPGEDIDAVCHDPDRYA